MGCCSISASTTEYGMMNDAKMAISEAAQLRQQIHHTRLGFNMMTQGKSMLVAGPSGTGKSTFMRRALRSLGGGVIALAPGADEMASYEEFALGTQMARWSASDDPAKQNDRVHDALALPPRTDDKPYLMATFADDDYLPSLQGSKAVAYAHRRYLRFLRAVAIVSEEAMLQGAPLPYPVLVTDTLSAIGKMAFNAIMHDMRRSDAPPAMSPEGAAFYTGYRNKMEEVMTVQRRLRGLGMYVLASAHVTEKEVKQKELIGGVETPSVKQILPMFTGQFREDVGAAFDLVLHSHVVKGACYLRWTPSMNRQSKSRVGALATDDKPMPNDFDDVMARVRAAKPL